MHQERTLKTLSVAVSAVRLNAMILSFTRAESEACWSLSALSGEMIMVTPVFCQRNGIWNGRVFSDPVGDMATRCLPRSWASQALIPQRYGVMLNTSWVLVRILESDGVGAEHVGFELWFIAAAAAMPRLCPEGQEASGWQASVACRMCEFDWNASLSWTNLPHFQTLYTDFTLVLTY